ncbi:hypothetical protein VB715_21140 [Crocosphaera sp. UHCC 0190]|uniref:hypothetical protein n=1 Tax=Crocosphaera sp. UHCC 0190 TaxID=3110246 RepID=UPI002B2072FC|nr:hypothetical protein [Crocosphaera sp. UHCC 0190]MEA5512281.1 hypothetical protein [Crocosphaera sp. UHCC 0190]
MEPLTALAGTVAIILTGALNRVGEMTLDGTIAQLKKLIEAKSPETLKKLESSGQNPKILPETIEVIATLIEDDTEIKEAAEKVAKENENNSYVINQFPKLEKILNFASRDINIKEQNITF